MKKIILSLIAFAASVSMAHESKITVLRDDLSSASLSQEERTESVVRFQRQMQLALYKLDCGTPTLVLGLDKYESPPTAGDEFDVRSIYCKVQPKAEVCEAGFNARNFPESLDLKDFKVCVQASKDSQPERSNRAVH